jgi:hypothetical protein
MADTAFPAMVEQAESAAEQPAVTFPELVHAHLRWRRALRAGDGDSAERRFRTALERFEAAEGRIVSAYWCSHVESAVALSERTGTRMHPQPQLRFHRVSDWATKGQPGVATLLHRCDELAIRAEHVLTGVRRSVCMQLAMAAASHVLSLVDARAAHDEAKTQEVVDLERVQLEEVERYYRDAANGQAQMVYFAGMALAAALIGGGLGCGLWVTFGNRELFGAMIAGAIGAVVSVIQRINTGSFEVEHDVGRTYVAFLGALRPAIGAVFGMALSLAVTSKMIRLPGVADTGDEHFAALLVVSFFAGFSERWAQDTLAASVPALRKTTVAQRGAAPARLPPGG